MFLRFVVFALALASTNAGVITFQEISHKCWKLITTLKDEVETISDKLKKIEQDKGESSSEGGGHGHGALIGISAEAVSPAATLENLNTNAKQLMGPSRDIISLLQITPDDDDKTENEEECTIRTKKVFDAAQSGGALSGDQLKALKSSLAKECAAKVDKSREAGEEASFRELWYNIRAASLRLKDRVAIFAAEFDKVDSKHREEKPEKKYL